MSVDISSEYARMLTEEFARVREEAVVRAETPVEPEFTPAELQGLQWDEMQRHDLEGWSTIHGAGWSDDERELHRRGLVPRWKGSTRGGRGR